MTSENTGLNPELMKKAKACTSPEELVELAKGENLELSLDELDSASGGTGDCPSNCSWVCLRLGDYVEGDTREGVDPALAHADFVNGDVDGGNFF
jgi:hypothetical protein